MVKNKMEMYRKSHQAGK